MNVFIDYIGHADLYYSMHLLFEKRLGMNLYCPIQEDQVWSDKKFLTPLVPNSTTISKENGVTTYKIFTHDYEMKAITFDKFLELNIDIIVITSRPNEFPLIDIAKAYKPKAKLAHHIANIREVPDGCRNIMLSTKTVMPKGINWIRYTPEHHEKYKPSNITVEKSIKSFFNYMRSYPVEMQRWNEAKLALPDFDFKMHGGAPPWDSEHGSISQDVLHITMQEAQFIWHTKPAGGCGYTARQALACGKPLIVDLRYSKNYATLADDYLIDGVNCINLDPSVRPLSHSFKMIKEWSEPDTYNKKVEDVKKCFNQKINFENEAEAIKKWLESL